jgi:hypothetical protein
VPAYAVWFSSYFAIRRWQQQQHRANGSTGTNDVIDSLMAGSAAGVLQWTLTLPMDAMKTRIQSRPLGERLPTIRQCWQQLAAGDGGSISARMRLLYRGYWAAVGRAIPSNGISWLVTETIFKWLTTRN